MDIVEKNDGNGSDHNDETVSNDDDEPELMVVDEDFCNAESGAEEEVENAEIICETSAYKVAPELIIIDDDSGTSTENNKLNGNSQLITPTSMEGLLDKIKEEKLSDDESVHNDTTESNENEDEMELIVIDDDRSSESFNETSKADYSNSKTDKGNNINLTEKQKPCMNDDKNICPTYNQITSTTEGKIISCAEKQIVSVTTDKLVSITEDEQVPISTDKPTSIAEDEQVPISTDKPTSIAEDKPASTAKDKPASIAEDKPTSIAEGKLASIIEDKPASSTENQSISNTKDKPGSMLEGKLTPVSKDKLISISEDKLTSVSENKLTSISKHKLTSTSKDKLTAIPEDKLTFTSKDKLTAILEDKLTSISENKLTSFSKDKLTPISKDKLTSASKDKLTSVSEDKLTSIPEDESTSILEGRPESISKGIRVSVAKDIPMFISENNSVSVAEDKSVSISKDKSVSITENKSTFFVENKSGPCAKDKLESSIVNKPVPLIEKKLGSFCENKSRSHDENKSKSLTENNSGPFIENKSETFAKSKSEFITENKSKSLSEDKSQFSTKVGLETPMGSATILPTEGQTVSVPINDILSFLKESVIDELLCDELYIKDNKASVDENKTLSQSTSKKISRSKSKEMLPSEGGSALKNTEIKEPSTTSEVQPNTEKQSVCVVKDSQDNPKTCDPDTGGSAQNTTEIKEPGTTSEVQPSTEKQSVCIVKDSQDNIKTCDSDIGGSAPKTTEIKEPSTTSEVQSSTEKQSVCVVKNSQDNPKTCDPDTGNTVVEQGDLSHMLECHLEIGAPSVEWAEMVQNWQKLQDPMLSLTTEGRPEAIHKIPEGNAKLGKDGFFNIKVLFTGTKKSYSFYGPNGHRLMMVLKAEKFLVDPVKWLIDKKIAAEITRCSACLCTQLRQIRTQVYNDGYAWVCLNPQCQHVYPFVRPPFFNKFNHSLVSLLAAIFHWAFQSHHQHAMTDTSLSMPELMTLYQTLQEICSLYTDNYDRDSKRVVKPYDIIEIAVYQFGSFLILALYERNAKLVRLQIIPFDEKHFVNAFLKFSASFIDRNHMVVSDCSLLEKLKIPCMGFAYPNPYITNEDDTGWHCLNVNSFFKQHVAGIFKKYRANSVNVEVWQGFLNEVEWRQRYGILNEMAFWGMLYCLSKKQAGAQSFERIIEPMVQTFPNQGTHSPTLPKTSNKARKSCFGQKTKLQDLSKQVNNDVGDSNVIDVESDARNGALFTQGGSTMKMNENEKRAITGSPSSFNVSKDINISDIYTSNNSLVDSSVSSAKPPQSDIMSSVMFQPDGLDAVTVTALLSIRTWPLVRYLLELLRVTKQPDNFDATVWRNKLKAEGFFNQPLKWLVDHGFAPGNTHCDKCQSNAVNCGENEQVYLTCRDHRCCYIQPFKRPKFFAKFGFPMKDLLFLLFHWVAQSPFQSICQDVFLTEYKVRYVFWGVQKHCLAVLLQDPKLGNPGHVIEVGIIQYGEFCILGALNKQTKETRLKALYAPLVYKSCVFEPTLNDWLCKGSTIMTSHNPFQLKDHKVIYTTEPNTPYDSKTITLYLKSVVCALFSQYSTIGIKVDIIQSFLDEIVWRQKYGHTPELAFISLLQQFSESELGYDRLIPQGKPVLSNSASPALNKDPLLSDNPVTEENLDTSFPISNNPSSKGKQLSSRKEVMTGKRKSSRLAASNHENVLCIEDNNDESNPDEPTSCKKQKLINKTEVLKIPALSAEQNKSAGVLISKYSRAEFCKKFRAEEFPEFEEYFQNQPSAVSEVRSNCLLSLEKEGGKLLKPLIVDSMQFLKNPKKQKKNYQKDECKNIVPLDEYYFAEMKSKVLPPLDPVSYVYSCTFCKIYLFGNIEVIDHTLKHIADMREKSKPKTFSCPFFIHRYISSASCLYEFSTKEERKKHVTDVHSTDSLSCLICSLPFRSSADLSQHMKRSHFPCEMPYTCPVCVYRSSLHKEVLEHFQLVHKDDPHLICPFCLKMCSPTRTDDPVLFTNAFSKHLFKHQDRGQNVKCPACCLLFFTYEELYAHAIRDHASFLNSADAVCFKVRCSPFVVLTETLSNPVPASTCHPVAIFANAKMSELIVKNNQLDAEKKIQRKMQPTENRCQTPLKLMSNEPSSVNYESDSDTEVPLEPIPNLQSHAPQLQDLMLLNDTSKRTKTGEGSPSFRYSVNHPVRCFECGNQVTNNHFYEPLSCHCTYVTYCAKAFALHVIKKHFAEGDTIQTTKVFAKLKENGVCSCSFSSDNVDTLAAHLKSCTGFINVKSTEFITKHQKEGNKVSVLLRHLKSGPSGSNQIALSHVERRDTNEQMGNMPPPNNFRIPDWQSIPQYLSNIPTSVSHPSTTSEGHRPVSTDTLEMLQRYSQQYLIPRSSAVSSLVVRETLNAQNANMYVPSPPPPPPPPPYPVHHPSYTLVPPKPNSRIKAGVMSVRNGITYIQEVPVAGRYPHSTPVQFGQRQGTSSTAGPHGLRPNILRNLLHDNALIGPGELPRRAVVIPNLNMQQRQQRQIQPTKQLQLRQQQFPVQLQQQSPIQLHQQPPIQLQQRSPIQLQQQPSKQPQQQQVQQPSSLNELKNLLTHIKQEKPD